MKRGISLLSIFILFIILIGGVDANQLCLNIFDNNNEPDFALNDYVLQPIQTGVYYFYVEAQNNGSANATTGTTSFEFRIDARIDVIKFKINEFPIEANLSEMSDGVGGSTRIFKIPNNVWNINVGRSITFLCTLISTTTTNVFMELFLNWTDGTRTNSWKLIELEEAVKKVDQPFFEILNSTLTDAENHRKKFSATIKNHGALAIKGNLPITWEEITYTFPLSGGQGTLNESALNLDINGDGDEVDTFEVKWFTNQTRQLDATINGVHAYALIETIEEEYTILTYYINDKFKLFKLGTNYHVLYECTEEYAEFGFNIETIHHPTPNFQFIILTHNLTAIQYINASDFRINGKITNINHTATLRVNYKDFWGFSPRDMTCYILPTNMIASGEEVTLSCTLSAMQNVTIDIWFWVNWTPDGNIRYRTPPISEMPLWGECDLIGFLTNSDVTTSNSSPGFTFTLLLAFLFICVYSTRKR